MSPPRECRRAKRIGKQVAARRSAAGLSIPELAIRLGVDRVHVWRIETGRGVPSLSLLEKMAALFGVTLDELRFGAQKNDATRRLSAREPNQNTA